MQTADRPEAPLARPRRVSFDAVTALTVYLVLLVVLPARLVVGPLGGWGSPAAVTALALLAWWAAAWLHPESGLARGRQPLRTALIAFLVALLLAYVAAMQRPLPELEVNAADRFLLFTAGWLGVALMAADGIDSHDRLDRLVHRLVAAGTFLAALTAVQYFTGIDIARYLQVPGLTQGDGYTSLLARDGLNRPAATATHPIELGIVLAVLLPLTVHRAMAASVDDRLRWSVRWGQVGVLSLALLLTVSKSAIIGTAVAMVVLSPNWSWAQVRRALPALFGFLLLVWFLVPGLLGTLRNLFSNFGRDSSTTARTDDYGAVAGTVAEFPWFGRGPGTYLPLTYRVLDNQYLLTVVETGVIGLASLVALFLTGVRLLRSARRRCDDEEHRNLGQALVAALVVVAFGFATFDGFSFPIVDGLLFILLGTGAAYWRLGPPGRDSPQEQPAGSTMSSGGRSQW